jgi:hypothetical protein
MDDVTVVTGSATQDDLNEQDYRDIFDELRQNLSLDKLIGVMGSNYSKATWSKYERQELELNRTMRSELRRAVQLPELPMTVGEAVAAYADPDATVWRIGERARHVILVATQHQLTLSVNGDVTLARSTGVTSVTRVTTPRKTVIRPVASIEQNRRRVALLASWKDVIEAGLRVLENRHAN